MFWNKSLHVLVQEFPVEVRSNCVVDEALGDFDFTLGLIPEDHVIIPPDRIKAKRNRHG